MLLMPLRRFRLRLSSGAALLVSVLAIPTTAWPQVGAEATQAASAMRPTHVVPIAPLSWGNLLSIGASIYTLDSTDIRVSNGENLSAVLTARVPGLSVLRSGGSAAEGSRLRLRGPRSFLMTTEPIVIVDGVRVDATQEASIIDVGVRVSRLDDIAPEDVARVDILPGPASASLFGPGAAGGAVVITTKRGQPGPLRWDARAESRMGMIPGDFPANYHMNGIDPATGQPTTFCDRLRVASGACVPIRLDVWNPLEQASPFRTARTAAGSVSLAGGVRRASGRLGVSGQRTLGVTTDDDDGRLSLRASLAPKLSDAVDLDFHGGYTRTSAGLPVRGTLGGIIASGLFGNAVDDDTARGYRFNNGHTDTRQRATHWSAGASATWRVKPWLTAAAQYGRDELDQREHQHAFGFAVGSPGPGTHYVFWKDGELAHATTTLATSLAASYPIARPVPMAATTIVGYQRLGSAHVVSDSEVFLHRRMEHHWKLGGPWVRQQLAWRDRVFVSGSLRGERRSVFGTKTPDAWFKSADIAWVFRDLSWLHGARLRAAYGEGENWMAGNLGVFSTTTSPFASDVSIAEPTERTAETEFGADARLGERITLALTVFRANASQLYVIGVGAPSTGFPNEVAAPVGSMRNEGIEASATLRIIDRARFRWDATVMAATLRNRVTALGDRPPITTSDGRTQIGYAIDGYWTRPYTYSDDNRDGSIIPNEIRFATANEFSGHSLPTREASLRSALSFPGGLTMSGLLDYRGGHKLSDANERVRCTLGTCRGAQDSEAPLEEQAWYAAMRTAGFSDPLLHDASFVKLRELGVSWAMPAAWSSYVGGRSAALTFSGRNLATWTRYKGLDPELTNRRFEEPRRQEQAKSPLVREVVLRLEVRN